jgi:hypothetical protein
MRVPAGQARLKIGAGVFPLHHLNHSSFRSFTRPGSARKTQTSSNVATELLN